MKTLEQIKNEYAKTKGSVTWDILVYKMKCDIILYSDFLNYENEVMKIYARECLKLASDNFKGASDFAVDVRNSITNENNIIK